jgi:hypothetical protein
MTESPDSSLAPPQGGASARAHDPVAILLLNLFLFGAVGYLRIGQREKAIVAAVLWFALAWPTCFSASLLFAAVAALDGYLQAQQLAEGRPLGKWSFFSRV